MRICLTVGLSVALVLSASTAFATSKPLPIGKIRAEQAQLRVELEGGSGRAAKISSAKRADLLARQQELLTMLEGKQSARELTSEQLFFARSTLAWIEATVESDDDGRLVCRREKTLGSNMATRVCRTVAQMKQDQERARAAMNTNLRE